MRTIKIFLTVFLLYFSCTNQENLLPDHFHGYPLKRKITGEEAGQFVNKLHSQNVATSKNEIGFYENDKRFATIYVSHYKNNKLVQTAFENMTDKISARSAVFIEDTFLDVNGVNVYRCFGKGKTHFIFVQDNRLFWLSVETITGRQFLIRYLEYLS